MNYQIEREPDLGRMAAHNLTTWMKIKEYWRKSGFVPMSRSALEHVCRDHVAGDRSKPTPGQFIDYCVRMGWLGEVE